MKIAAIIDEFSPFTKEHRQFIRQVREKSKADLLIAVMSGDFLQQGIPAAQNKYARAAYAVEAGVDFVIELPVYCTLSSPDTYAYAAVSMLESLHCIDELYIACDTKAPGLLFDVARFLFIEPRDYQLRLKAYRSSGMSFYDAQANAVGQYIEKAKHLLKNPANIFAAEYLRALKRIYSRIRPCFINAPTLSPLGQKDVSAANNTYISALLNYELCTARKNMDEIYGGTSILTESICQRKRDYDSFNSFSAQLKTPTRSHANIRRYMLNFILGVRKADIAICRLYSFSPYLRVIGCNPDILSALDDIRSHTRTPIFLSSFSAWQTTDEKTKLVHADPALVMLSAFDSRAHQIYRLAFAEK